MSRLRQVLPVLAAIGALIVGVMVGNYSRQKRSAIEEHPARVTVSYPDGQGRKVHILKVTNQQRRDPHGMPPAHDWRILLSTPQGVWVLDAEEIETAGN